LTGNLRQFQKRLGYEFKNRDLLLLSLSHRSVGACNNERLEYIGDSLLNAVISTRLYEIHDDIDEGALTRLRANLVNQNTLSELAQEIDLGNHLILGTGELKSGGQRRASILADALEALFGAIFIEAGYAGLHDVILRLFKTRLERPVSENSLKDYKTQLQETLQARNLPLPVYEIKSVQGQAHKLLFEVNCAVEALAVSTIATAGSRRAAEQKAALQALELIKDA
jgi:ribonuclease-3